MYAADGARVGPRGKPLWGMGRRRWWRALGALVVVAAALICIAGPAHDASALALPPKGATPGEYVATAGGSLLEGLGNGGLANFARLNDPAGVAVNANGDVFIADADDNMVREVLPSGVIDDFAGTGVAGYYGDGGPAYNAQLDHPEGVAVDAAGDVFIADTDNNVVREVNTSGVISTIAGTGTAGYSGNGGLPTDAELDLPTAVSVNASGQIAIADTGNDLVRVVYTHILLIDGPGEPGGSSLLPLRTHSADGPISFPMVTEIATVAGQWDVAGDAGDGGYGTSATLEYPEAVAWDANGDIDIADTGNSAIRSLNFESDEITALFHVPYPTGVSVAPNGAVVVSDPTDHVVDAWTSGTGLVRIIGTGTIGDTGVGGKASLATLAYPRAVAVDQYGDVFVADSYNQNVRELVVARKPQFLTETPSLVSAPAASYTYDFIVGAVPEAHIVLSGAPSWLHLTTATWPNAVVSGTLPAGVTSFTYSVVASNIYGVTTAGPFRVTVPQLSDFTGADGPVDVVKGPNNALWFTNFTGNSIVEMTTLGVTRSFTSPLVKGPFCIAVGTGNTVWFTDSSNNTIGRITSTGVIHVFTGATIHDPFGIALGPDGNMWFTNHTSNTIGRITPTGVISTFPSSPSVFVKGPEGITAGPNNAMYFANYANDSIGKISMTGALAAVHNASISGPTSIVEGPDDALWFDNSTGNSIGRVTSSGVVTSYSSGSVFDPQGITVGPDHALWFTNAGNDTIGRVTTSGVVTFHGAWGIDVPEGITTGPDGALWFCDFGTSNIGRMSTSMTTTFFADTVAPRDITLGPDGALWFTLPSTNSIGRISTTGAIETFVSPYMDVPDGITTGPDGNLWFTNYASDYIGRITPAGVVTGYSDPSVDGATSIAPGLFGELWFTNYLGDSIGQITTAGVITSETGATVDGPYSIVESGGEMWFTNLLGDSIGAFDQYGDLYNYPNLGINEPVGIAAGSDGNVWFTNLTGNDLGVVLPSGSVAFVHGTGFDEPSGIATGPDGALWFTNALGTAIGRSTTTGFVTSYSGAGSVHTESITAGPDYALWFTSIADNAIGRITG